ncbi:hypothetical protein [Amycolatopsis sp. lyj-90]|uniref:hypothetical protein n=1 Tax=Amycolatopsis sp. lyj-90 TaxID=2789285 RepID=UPI00397BF127
MTGLLIFAAAAVTGGLLGFLFGIPRVLQADGQGANESAVPRLLVNTNLEQVSDWLTKILVGIGLVEFTRIIDSSGALFTRLGAAFAPRADAAVLAGTLVVAGIVLGFLGGYVVTRTWLTHIFRKADLTAIEKVVKEEVSKRISQDGDAMRMVMQQLDSDEPVIEVNQLAEALGSASSTARAQVFQLAGTQRRTSWRTADGKPRLLRTVPVFQALTQVAPHEHRYWGELGFALAEQTPPDDKAAVDVLTVAIERRDNAGDAAGWYHYEFVRAQARLRALNGAPADAATRDLVLADARIAMSRPNIKKIIESAPPGNGRDVVGIIRSYVDERPQVRVSTKPEVD